MVIYRDGGDNEKPNEIENTTLINIKKLLSSRGL